LTRLAGTLAADFSSVPDPACRILDTCATSGTNSYSFAASSGYIYLTGHRRTDRRHTTVSAELRAVKHGRYRLTGFGLVESGPKPRVSEKLVSGGVVECSDSLVQDFPSLAPQAGSGVVKLTLGEPTRGFSSQPFTHCAGPFWNDVFGQKGLAVASAPIRALGRPHLRLTATRPGGFEGKGYTGSRRGQVAVSFRLVGASAYVTTKRPLP